MDNFEDLAKQAYNLCKKFINKVETGRARSVETYCDCKNYVRNYLIITKKED